MLFVTASELVSHRGRLGKTVLGRTQRFRRHQPIVICSSFSGRILAGTAGPQLSQVAIDPGPTGNSLWPAPVPGEPDVADLLISNLNYRAPKAHNATTSPELLRRRQEQRAAAQALTTSLIACRSVTEAKTLYECHGEQFNAIHFAALFTALGRLTFPTAIFPQLPPAYNAHPAPSPGPPVPTTATAPTPVPTTAASALRLEASRPDLKAAGPSPASRVITQTPPSPGASSIPFGGTPTLCPPVHQPPRHVITVTDASGQGLHLLQPSPPPSPSTRSGLLVAATQPTAAHSIATTVGCVPTPTPAIRHRTLRSKPLRSPITLARGERGELLCFVSQHLLPHVGSRLMSLGSRQLAAVLAALAQLDCQPPDFWLSEWLQHFVRRLDSQPVMAMALAPARSTEEAAAASAAAAFKADQGVEGSSLCRCRISTDISRAMWALARLRMRRHRSGALPLSASLGAAGETAPAAAAEAAAVHAAAAAEGAGLPAASRMMRDPSFSSSDVGVEQRSGDRLSAAAASRRHVSDVSRWPVAGADTFPSRHVDCPSLVWLQTVAHAFAAQAAAASAADLTSYLWAAARLGYRPPAEVMAVLMTRCGKLLGGKRSRGDSHNRGNGATRDIGVATSASAAADGNGGGDGCMGSRELCVVLWSLAVLGFYPGERWLRRIGGELEHMAGPVGGLEAVAATVAAAAAAAEVVQVEEEGEDEASQCAAAGPAPAPLEEAAAVPVQVLAAPMDVEPDEGSDWWSAHLGISSFITSVVRPTSNAAALKAHAGPCTSTVSSSTTTRRHRQGEARDGDAAGGGLPLLDSRQAATCLWAFAKLGHRPSERVANALLRCACAAPAAAAAAAPASQDISMASFALGVLRFRPEPAQAMTMLRGMAARMRDASPQDLVVWVAALARMRLAVPDPWFATYLRRAAREQETLPPLALVNWLDAVARLRTARPPRRSQLVLELMAQRKKAQRQKALLCCARATMERSSTDDDGGDGRWETPPAAGHHPRAATCIGTSSAADCGDGDGDDDDFSDPWVVVALPEAKLPRAEAREAAAAGQQRARCPPRRHRCHQRHRRRAGRNGTSSRTLPPHSPPPLPPSIPAVTPTLGPVSPPAHCSGSTAATSSAIRMKKAPTPAAMGIKGGRWLGDPVFIRPASRHLQRQRLLPRLLRLAAARLPHLDLEQHCRLAWAVAHLNTAVRRAWVDALIAQTTEALERRLRLRSRSPPLRPLHQQLRRAVEPEAAATAAATASAPAAVPALEDEEASPAVAASSATSVLVPVLDARWLLKLARAVEMMLRGPQRGPGRRRLELAQRRRCLRRVQADEGGPAAAVKTSAAASYSYIPRRWRLLLMMAMLPQLPSLTNAQLLRFVRTLARLRGGEAATAASTAAASTVAAATAGMGAVERAARGASGVGATDSEGLPVGGRRGPQRRLAAEIGSYCRRRVEATCSGGGGEAPCDLATSELLRWTRGWERPRSFGGCEGREGATAKAGGATAAYSCSAAAAVASGRGEGGSGRGSSGGATGS